MSCVNPFFKLDRNNNIVNIPCGRCIACRIDKRNEYEMRMQFELHDYKGVATFFCLTYDDEHIPINDNGFVSLRKSDLQKFLKRLRRHAQKKYKMTVPLKYFCVGEMGEKHLRPHYHGIVFGLDFQYDRDLFIKSWKNCYEAELFTGPVARGGIRYVLKYLDKQFTPDMFDEDLPYELPFRLISKGLGYNYFFKHYDEIVNENGIYYKGKYRPLPRYYQDLFGLENKKKRVKKISEHQERFLRYKHLSTVARANGEPVEHINNHFGYDLSNILDNL